MTARFRAFRRLALLVPVAAAACSGQVQVPAGRGVLELRITEGGRPVPARVEVLSQGGEVVPIENAIPLIGDCDERLESLTVADVAREARSSVVGYFDQRTFSYANGVGRAVVDPGTYSVRVLRGLETRAATAEIDVAAGEVASARIELERWIDLASEGWVSGDVHLHVPRLDRSADEDLHDWLAAEDLRVAHFLEFGNSRGFGISPQLGYGAADVATRDGALLVPGHENPRVSFLGHLLLLGIDRRIHHADDYFDTLRFAREAHAAGGLVAMAHQGNYGGEAGAALLLPYGELDGIEVMTRTARYGLWYDALNAGFDVAPLAGTDYPCGTGAIMPGAQRVYARIAGEVDAATWIAAARAGEVFVTNGPVPTLTVDGVGPGGTVTLGEPGVVRIEASVRSDPGRHRVERVELIVGGRTQTSIEADGRSVVPLVTELEIEQPTWVALRVTGTRVDAALDFASFAHTGAVRVEIAGTPRPRRRLGTWLDRLDELEAALAPGRWGELPSGSLDGVSSEFLERHREELIESIAAARAAYERFESSARE